MTVFVYKKRKLNLIMVSEEVRQTDEEIQELELLYKITDSSISQITRDLRPYQCLWVLPGVYFKPIPEVLEYFEEEQYLYPKDVPMTNIDPEKALERILELSLLINKFKQQGIINFDTNKIVKNKETYRKSLSNLKYSCDIYNYLYDTYGEKITNLIQRYEDLSPRIRELIDNVKNYVTKETQASYLNDTVQYELGDNFESILDFLPEWYRVRYKLSNFNSTIASKNPESGPECSTTKNLGKTDKQLEDERKDLLRKQIYEEFEVGETYSGWYIIDKLRKIYTQLKIKKKAMICDLQTYFDYKNVTYLPKVSAYKLISKK